MIINNYKNERFIKWIVNNNCNYNCKYCFEKDFHKKDVNIDFIIKTAYKINEFIKINNINSIILLGGELFLLNKETILQILNILKNKKINLYIISNFSKDNLIYKEVSDFANNNFKSFEYKFSFHDEYISVQDFFYKVENYLQNKKNEKIKLQFTLTKDTEKYLQDFLNNVNILQSKGYNVSEHIEKAYYFNNDRSKISFDNDIKTKLSKTFSIDNNQVAAEEIFKDGPMDNYGAKCFQPFFHLENNILYSHCYGRIITNDFINYIPDRINNTFICNRHSCLIYKTSIIKI